MCNVANSGSDEIRWSGDGQCTSGTMLSSSVSSASATGQLSGAEVLYAGRHVFLSHPVVDAFHLIIDCFLPAWWGSACLAGSSSFHSTYLIVCQANIYGSYHLLSLSPTFSFSSCHASYWTCINQNLLQLSRPLLREKNSNNFCFVSSAGTQKIYLSILLFIALKLVLQVDGG